MDASSEPAIGALRGDGRRTRPLRLVAAAWALLALLLGLGLSVVMIVHDIDERAWTEARTSGANELGRLAAIVERTIEVDPGIAAELKDHTADQHGIELSQIEAPNGEIVASMSHETVGGLLSREYPELAAWREVAEAPLSPRTFERRRAPFLTLARTVTWPAPPGELRSLAHGRLFLGIDTRHVADHLRTATLHDHVTDFVVFSSVLLLLMFVLDRVALRPLGALRDATARLTAGDLAYRIPTLDTNVRELALLAQDFNLMASAVASTVQRLSDSEHGYRTLLAAAPEAIIAVDTAGRIQHYNRAAEHLFGHAANEVLGESLERLMPAAARAVHAEHLQRFVQEGDAEARRMLGGRLVPGLHRDGRALQLEVGISRSSIGGNELFTAMIRDVTERVAIERELERHRNHLEVLVRERTAEVVLQRDRAEAATRAKSEFLANMSHEIRTPMNAIIGLAWLARRHAAREQVVHLDKLTAAARHLLAILNDILDFSKLEAGKLEIAPRDTALLPLLDQVAQLFATPASEKGVELVAWPAADLPAVVTIDDLRLRQVLMNLLGNAVKFTERGHVCLRVRILSRDGDMARLCFDVTDSGAGIDATTVARLCQPFEQGDASLTRRHGGTGLGLAISQRLLGMMGSRLEIDSAPGHGSRFGFVLSARVVADAATPPPAPAQATGRTLLVDDLAEARLAGRDVLSALGIDVAIAAGLDDAGAALREAAAAGRPFATCVLDWRLGEVDGIAAARSLAAVGGSCRLLLSVDGSVEPAADMLADAGIAGVLPKPLDAATLALRLPDLLGRPGPALPPPMGPALLDDVVQELADRRGRRVLVAEDNALNQEVFSELLKEAGLQPVIAADGVEALRAVEREGAFDLVLMDMQMPRMDGLEATRRIRALPGTAALPIVALTANAQPRDRERCREAGMNDFLGKPIDFDEFTRVLARWLPARADADADGTAGPVPAAALVLPGVDVPAGLRMARGNVDAYRRLLARFAAVHRDDGASLRAPDVPAALAVAHGLKSTAGAIGAVAVARAVADFEAAPGPVTGATLAATLDSLIAAIDGELAPDVGDASPRARRTPDTAAVRHALRERLLRRDLSALRYAQDQRPAIRACFGRQADTLLAQIDDFDFDAALELIEAAQPAAAAGLTA